MSRPHRRTFRTGLFASRKKRDVHQHVGFEQRRGGVDDNLDLQRVLLDVRYGTDKQHASGQRFGQRGVVNPYQLAGDHLGQLTEPNIHPDLQLFGLIQSHDGTAVVTLHLDHARADSSARCSNQLINPTGRRRLDCHPVQFQASFRHSDAGRGNLGLCGPQPGTRLIPGFGFISQQFQSNFQRIHLLTPRLFFLCQGRDPLVHVLHLRGCLFQNRLGPGYFHRRHHALGRHLPRMIDPGRHKYGLGLPRFKRKTLHPGHHASQLTLGRSQRRLQVHRPRQSQFGGGQHRFDIHLFGAAQTQHRLGSLQFQGRIIANHRRNRLPRFDQLILDNHQLLDHSRCQRGNSN